MEISVMKIIGETTEEIEKGLYFDS